MGVKRLDPLSSSTASMSDSTPYTSRPTATAASAAFCFGRMSLRTPFSKAMSATLTAPSMGRSLPSRPISPRIMVPSSSEIGTEPCAAAMAMAIGRSSEGPSLRMSPGARLTKMLRLRGQSSSEFRTADLTRSRLSSTALSGRPTSVKRGSPEAGTRSTSMTMGNASIPTNVAE